MHMVEVEQLAIETQTTVVRLVHLVLEENLVRMVLLAELAHWTSWSAWQLSSMATDG